VEVARVTWTFCSRTGRAAGDRSIARHRFAGGESVAAMKLEEYGFIGDLHTGALVGSNGSIDWLCLPRFDSDACFAALLGTKGNGHWQIAPAGPVRNVRRRYRPHTLVLETEFETDDGVVRLIDCMPPADKLHNVVRVVEGVRGKVRLAMHLVIRFDYGLTVPWVSRDDGALKAIAGPNALVLRTDVDTYGEDLSTCADFTVGAGERRTFVLTWFRSHESPPGRLDALRSVEETEQFWKDWCARCKYEGPWTEAVVRSLITLKALTFKPTGGIVAAATTSLPEHLGGVRNWDYRYCWLRDATFTLLCLMDAGYSEEAAAWSDWLLRAVAGDPSQLRIMYGPAGERRLPEHELSHLCGYENSRPVRIGNAAYDQFQLDVYGEVLDAAHLKREIGLPTTPDAWHVQRHLVEFVAKHWRDADEGIWEVRGPRRHFTHSKVMAWVTLDRGVKSVEEFGLRGDVGRWRQIRDEIHADVCAHGCDRDRGIFVQYYGGPHLDASLLMMPLVGFLPASDPRMKRTIHAIRDELTIDGLVHRYHPEQSEEVDGLPPGEGAFLPCSFWMVDCLHLLGEQDEARRYFEHLLTLRNPLGLLSEEYDLKERRLVGNFPQAFSHVALINSAQNLSRKVHPAEERSGKEKPQAGRRAATA
jgi:GH15 family glucan-1,4-alpha-glucosidase